MPNLFPVGPYRLLVVLLLVLLPAVSRAQWTPVGNLSFRGEAMGSMFFIDEMNGWVGHDDRTGLAVSRTTDGGVTWRTVSLPGCANCGFVSQVVFTSPLIGWASTEANRVDTSSGEYGLGLFKTVDGGLTWVSQGVINDATSVLARGNTVVVTNRRPPPNASIISRDGGVNFQPIVAVDPANDVAFGATTNTIVLSGFEDYGWARSINNGANWQFFPTMPESWSIYGRNNNFFAAPEEDARFRNNVVGGSSVLRSLDGGATWNLAYDFPFYTQGHIDGAANALYVQMDNTQLMRSARPGLLRSDDNGLTWKNVDGPLGLWDRRFDVVGCVGGVVYASDNKGNLYKTRTGGDGTLVEPPFTLQFSDDTVSVSSLICGTNTTRVQFRNLYCTRDSVVEITIDDSPLTTSGAISLESVPTLPKIYRTDEGDYFDIKWDPGKYIKGDTTVYVKVRLRYYALSGTLIDTVVVVEARARGAAPTAQIANVFDFGEIPSCVPADSLMPIQNTGCDTLYINQPVINPSSGISLLNQDGSPLTYPIVIPPGGRDTILVYVDPQGIGPFSMNLRLPALHQKIVGAFDVIIRGEVVPTEAQFLVAFDSFAVVVDSTLLTRDTMTRCDPPQEFFMYVRNPGCVEVALRNAIFEGNGTVFRAQVDGVIPDTLTGADVARIRITVTPNGLGQITDRLRIRYKVGDAPSIDLFYPFTVYITYGTRILTMLDDPRDMDTIEYCEIKDTVILFQNTGCDTLTLTEASLFGPDFQLRPPNRIPRTIAPGAFDSVRVRYVPLLPGGASGQVILVTDGDGDSDRVIEIFAAAKPTDTVSFHLVPDRFIVYSNDTMHFDLFPDTTLSGKGLNTLGLSLTYNGDVLTFMSATPQLAGLQIVTPPTEIVLGPKMRQIRLTIGRTPEIPLDSLSSLISLQFRTTLSDSSHVTMELKDLTMNGGDATFQKCVLGSRTEATKLDLTLYCGDSLIKKMLIHDRIFLSTMQPHPNPSSKSKTNDVVIPYELGKASKLMLKVYSMEGKIVYETSLDARQGKGDIQIPLEQLSSGTHYYELQAQNGIARGQFVVTK